MLSFKIMWRHAANQIRTVWQMTQYRYAAPYDIQTHDPALKWSFIAFFASFAPIAVFDYLNYPSELLAGYFSEEVSRGSYVAVYALAAITGSLLAYLVMGLLAKPLGFAGRFWHGLIGLNWWWLLVSFAIFPLLLALLVLGENDAFYSPALVILLVVYVMVIWKSLNLLRHTLKTGWATTVLVCVIGTTLQIVAMMLLTSAFGITMI